MGANNDGKVFYCPNCGHIYVPGERVKVICCPEMEAVEVPRRVALQAAAGFLFGIDEWIRAGEMILQSRLVR